MSQLSDYLENKIVDHIFRSATFPKPAALWVGLFTTSPSDASPGTEVSGGSYARVQRNPLDTNWDATQGGTVGVSSGVGGLTQNSGNIVFPLPTAAWGWITHVAIFDAPAAGNMLLWGALTVPKSVNNGDPSPTFAAGDLDITFA